MRLVADEGVDYYCVGSLRTAGHQVTWVAEVSPGARDSAVLALAVSQQAVLVTFDKDFGTLVYERRSEHRGVILVRLPAVSPPERAKRLLDAVTLHGGQMPGAFTVLSGTGLRIRHSAP